MLPEGSRPHSGSWDEGREYAILHSQLSEGPTDGGSGVRCHTHPLVTCKSKPQGFLTTSCTTVTEISRPREREKERETERERTLRDLSN